MLIKSVKLACRVLEAELMARHHGLTASLFFRI